MIYRSDADAATHRRERVLSARLRERRDLPLALLKIYPHRVGLIAAGAAGIAGALALFTDAMLDRLLCSHLSFGLYGHYTPSPQLTALALFAPLLAATAYFLGQWAARRDQERRLDAALSTSGDLYGDIARLERLTPRGLIHQLAAPLEQRSVALPLIALSLLAPLSLHFLFTLLFGVLSFREFSSWVATYLLYVGHTNLLLALVSWRFAK